ncbi:MAG: hypothetical protein K9N51_07365, partial [Candidatus Pacebacteria bacterium]|nr:hypothetical protein [Candidatus Paceibacterota bacterium]
KGQNARLASKLTGWRIDIQKFMTEEGCEFQSRIRQATETLVSSVPEIGDDASKLVGHGFLSEEGLLEADVDDLTTIPSIDKKRAQEIIDAVRARAGN